MSGIRWRSPGVTRVEYCTIAARNYLAGARVLARSVQEQLGQVLHVLVVDALEDERDAFRNEPFTALLPGDIGLAHQEFRSMAMIYEVTELATSAKPFLLRALLERRGGTVCYLDPDIVVYSDLGDLEQLLAIHDVVLTPHMTAPLDPDGGLPDETVMLQTGSYNLGFVAVGPGGAPMLDWWAERLRRECLVRPTEGRFVDQRWMDLAPSYFDVAIWKDPGCNVAYWNLHDREVTRGATGYEVNGGPLRFFHFSGFSPLQPDRDLEVHPRSAPPRVPREPDARAPVPRLPAGRCSTPATSTRCGSRSATRTPPTAWSSTASCGHAARGAILRHDDDPDGELPPDPFDRATAGAFIDWIVADDPFARFPLTRYEMAMWDCVPELRVPVPPSGRDAGRVPRPPRAIRPARPRVAHRAAAAASATVGRAARRRAGRGCERRRLPRRGGRRRRGRPAADRHLARRRGPVRDDRERRHGQPPRRARFAPGEQGRLRRHVACINADEMPFAADRLGDDLHVGGPIAGIWAWEVEDFPAWMAVSEALVDEVWTYSEHSAAAIRAAVSCPVFVVPPPIAEVAPPPLSRADLHLPEGYLFLFCFDAQLGVRAQEPARGGRRVPRRLPARRRARSSS